MREASSGENSTSSHLDFAWRTPSTASRMISSLRHVELVLAMDRAGGEEHVQARPRGFRDRRPGLVDVLAVAARERRDDRDSRTRRAISATASQSPCEAAGNPASMTSTPRSARARATRSFSGCVMLHPGDCSPSRSVVSKIITRFGSGALMVRYSIKRNPAATESGRGFRICDPSGISPAAHALAVEGAAASQAAGCRRCS